MRYRLGVDIGGTFADMCVFDEDTQTLHTLKILTSPDNPGREIATGLEVLRERYGIDATHIQRFIHGTTVGINAIIQRKGVSLALITTAGFEDVIEIARLRAPDPYDLFSRKAEPLVSRDRVFGVDERISSDGSVDVALDVPSVLRAIEQARASGVVGIVVSLLNSYRNDAHERVVCALVERHAPELFVFRSSEVWPMVREYERTTTTILNGYVYPIVNDYLDALQRTLKAAGVPAVPMITKSNGGVMSCDAGKRQCVNILLSGTASGVIGAAHLGNLAGELRLLTLDIGGTSSDVALVLDGKPQFGTGEVIGEFPLYIPSVSVTSIGDGGGSIASVDSFGVLKVGPESAGSVPGPACYGRGGTQPTITDAMLLCGFLGHQPLAYGALQMDREKARQVMEPLAAGLGISVNETAQAIIRVAISGMYAEIAKLTARYGTDVRDLTLMPFGGAGPMLGCFLARELGVHRVLIPFRPGTVSALGGLMAEIKGDFARSIFCDLDVGAPAVLKKTLEVLTDEAMGWIETERSDTSQPPLIQIYADMVYAGQSFDIEVELQSSWILEENLTAIAEAFHAQHEMIYAHSDPRAPVRIINIRIVATEVCVKPELPILSSSAGRPVPFKMVQVHYSGIEQEVPVYRRDDLAPTQRFNSPAIIAQEDTTVCIPSGFMAQVDQYGNILLTLTE